MINHGPGSNYTDGSDRQIVRAVAESCGWELWKIQDRVDFFTRQTMDAMVSVECEYEQEADDIYCRQLVSGALRSDHGTHSMWGTLADTITMLRTHQRYAWMQRLKAAREPRAGVNNG